MMETEIIHNYGTVSELKHLQNKIATTTNSDKLIEFVLSAKNYIFSSKVLGSIYLKYVRNFCNIAETEDFFNILNTFCLTISKYIQEHLKSNVSIECIKTNKQNLDKGKFCIKRTDNINSEKFVNYLYCNNPIAELLYILMEGLCTVKNYNTYDASLYAYEMVIFSLFEQMPDIHFYLSNEIIDNQIRQNKEFQIYIITIAMNEVLNIFINNLSKIPVKQVIYINNNNDNAKCIEYINKRSLTKEEIRILKLRKTMNPNYYKNIAAAISSKTKESTVKQCFMHIKNKLGANTPDEAIRFFEENTGCKLENIDVDTWK